MMYYVLPVHYCMIQYKLDYNKRVDSRISAWCCPRRARWIGQDILVYTDLGNYKSEG
jgi:hypothetical protein